MRHSDLVADQQAEEGRREALDQDQQWSEEQGGQVDDLQQQLQGGSKRARGDSLGRSVIKS